MTTPLIPVPGHEFARDRAPYADPLGLVQWRYRWNCSCGAAGRWQTLASFTPRQGWRKHLKNLRARERAGQRSDTDVRTS